MTDMNVDVFSLSNSKNWRKSRLGAASAEQDLDRFSWESFWRYLLLGIVGLTLAYVSLNLLVSAQGIDDPFAGFLHQNRVVVRPDLPPEDGSGTSLQKYDILLSVDGLEVLDSAWLAHYIRNQSEGQVIEYRLLRGAGLIVEASEPTRTFTWQDFVQLVALPTFFAFVFLITAGAAVYLRPDLMSVRLFTLFSTALVLHLTSFPGHIHEAAPAMSFFLDYLGKIIMPSLLLHFLLIFYQSHRLLESRPFLLPLIYMPILPALTHLPGLWFEPATTQSFDMIIRAYTVIYAVLGTGILLRAVIRMKVWSAQIQAVIMLAGLLLPTALLLVNLLATYPTTGYGAVFDLWERYGFIGVPIAVIIVAIRYESFGINRTKRALFFYTQAIFIALLTYVCLIAFINPAFVQFNRFRLQDGPAILMGIAIFFIFRLVYGHFYTLITDLVYGRVEEFQAGYRIFSRALLGVESRRDLERLISWEVPASFKLKNAQLTNSEAKPSFSYAIKYPLTVSNLSLGTLYIGEKLSKKPFTAQELEILDELTEQLSLALWSFELDLAIQKVEELTRLKSKFLAHVTHELRTPLNSIINYIGFVLDDYANSLNPEQVDHLEQALHGAERLLQIINNILDMSKIEAGQMVLNVQLIDLTEILAEISPRIERLIGDKPVQLVTEISPELSQFQGDRLRVRQIVFNILSNAAKFTERGMIHLSAYAENGMVTIQVKDTGPGVDEKNLTTIFQHFTRVGLTDAGQNLGPGLSMPITKSLVELHGGHIYVESRVGEGTTFTVTLPLTQNEQPSDPGPSRLHPKVAEYAKKRLFDQPTN